MQPTDFNCLAIRSGWDALDFRPGSCFKRQCRTIKPGELISIYFHSLRLVCLPGCVLIHVAPVTAAAGAGGGSWTRPCLQSGLTRLERKNWNRENLAERNKNDKSEQKQQTKRWREGRTEGGRKRERKKERMNKRTNKSGKEMLIWIRFKAGTCSTVPPIDIRIIDSGFLFLLLFVVVTAAAAAAAAAAAVSFNQSIQM